MQVQPYLSFNGCAEEALNFYQEAIGAELVMLMRFKENPEPQYNPPGSEEKVMHMSFRVGDSVLMGSDGDCSGNATLKGIRLALGVDTAEEAEEKFARLSAGGTIDMPLMETFFSPKFGMLTDRFGLGWMVRVNQ
ncbi:MAG: VOC family protein [Candidatus Hydrogenedens sp.]|nr:VOC family protein [Candidatus Hydrogenedens sp.]